MSDPTPTSGELDTPWAALRNGHSRIRTHDAATELGVSELELVAAGLGARVTRLTMDFARFLPSLESLGHVTTLTRNDGCVIETAGTFMDVEIFDWAAQVIAPGIDLRIFRRHWVHAFAVEKDGRGRRSLQIFDRHGVAVHEIFLTPYSDIAAYRSLVDAFRHREQDVAVTLEPRPGRKPERPDDLVDREALLDAWTALSDVHSFLRLLRRFGVSRTQALRLAQGRYTRRVGRDSARRALELAAGDGVPLMAFVGNPGTIQIHTGRVRRVVRARRWLNVMDPWLHLHLDQARVASAWVVKKPTGDGAATSLEVYDTCGDAIVLFFGVPKAGRDCVEAWDAAAGSLE